MSEVPACYNFSMEEYTASVTWEALEHEHREKTSDWYWALVIIAIAAAGVTVIFGNVLFAIVIILGASVMVITAMRKPKMIDFGITTRGITIGNELYPYTLLESFYIDEECASGPQLLVKSGRLFMPLIIMPLPEDALDEIDQLISSRLPEEHLEEPLAHKVLEFVGF